MEQRRSHFRIEYNALNCPILKLAGIEFNVLDLSEAGIRFSMDGFSGLKVEMDISGSLTFRDGESFLLHGKVIRIDDNKVSLTLKKPIPLRKIMSEQRALITSAAKAK